MTVGADRVDPEAAAADRVVAAPEVLEVVVAVLADRAEAPWVASSAESALASVIT